MVKLLKLVVLLFAVAGVTACGGSNANRPILINTKAQPPVAIKGYDPVAYFEQQKPVKGSAEHSYQWQAATWHFASAENRQAFVDDPVKYAPQYGGWCAFAMARGKKVDIDPDAWAIVDDKLYLNYSIPTQGFWVKQRDRYIREADEQWKTVGKR